MLLNKYVLGLALGLSVTAFAAGTASATNVTISDHKVGICHATGSKTNPYVFIVVDKHAANAHAKHQDHRDVIGVSSAAKCPKPAVKAATAPTATPAPGKGTVLGTTATPAAEAAPTTLPETGGSMGLSALIGFPAMYLAGRAYLRSRQS
jgi:hypothetical protein